MWFLRLLLPVFMIVPACQSSQTSAGRNQSLRYSVLKPLTEPLPPSKPRFLRGYAGYNYGPDRPSKRALLQPEAQTQMPMFEE